MRGQGVASQEPNLVHTVGIGCDDPGLSTHFGEDPAERIGEERCPHDRQGQACGPFARANRLAMADAPQHPHRRDHAHETEADHSPERPVGDDERRAIVVFAVLFGHVGLKLVDPGNRAVKAAGRHECQYARYDE